MKRSERLILKARTMVWDRDDVQCARCAYVTYSAQIHHRRIKGMGGDPREHTDCPCNLIVLCPGCHEWAHVLDRPAAEAQGFIIPSVTTTPGLEPVLRYGRDRAAWPTCDGRWVHEAPAGVTP